jgi:uncharacterized protein (DUF302 family)
MSYYISRTLTRPFDDVVADVVECLKAEGFGVLTDIDIQATLKAKIGVDGPRYRILGACNPRFAHEALQLENKLGVLLPCNVIVRDAGGGEVEVATIDPVTQLGKTGNAALAGKAGEVRQKLERTITALR